MFILPQSTLLVILVSKPKDFTEKEGSRLFPFNYCLDEMAPNFEENSLGFGKIVPFYTVFILRNIISVFCSLVFLLSLIFSSSAGYFDDL